MAEIRKHKPGASSAIGDQVRASLGAGPRPVEPGSQPAPRFDPFYSPDADASAEPNAASVPGFAAVSIGTDGWFSVDAAALAAGKAKPAAVAEDAAAADEDDEDDDA